MDPTRIELAEQFLQEAVYRSRTQQAAIAAVAPDAGCGLGARPAVVLALDARGQELFDALWPAGLDEPALERVRAATRAWVRAQDGLDRRRNHFMKGFRHEHGFDRRAYAAAVLAAYESGLDEINAEALAARRAAAEALLAGC